MSSNDLKTITGHGYDWQMKDCYTDDEHIEIQAWCLDKESKPFLLRIQDYPVTCYIELPTFIGRRSKIWTRHDCQDVFNYISFRMSDNRPTGFIFKYMPKLYYYRALVNNEGEYESKKYPMLWIMFKNLRAMYYCRKILENPVDIRSIGRCKFSVWETGIRLHRKMLTMIGLQYSQWFNAEVTEVDPDFRISKSPEYIVSYKNIEAIDPEITVTWNTNPRIIAYDIETYSSNHNAFPSEYYAKDVVYIITVIFQIVGVRESRKRYAIVYGDTKDISRAKIIKTNTEMELIDEFENLIEELDPEIITGYNINGFDNKYLKARKELRLRTWNPSVGRIPSDNPEVKKISWSSKGYGDKQMYTFLFAGRICIDLFQIVKRENKFSTYDLNTVSKHFLGRTKHDVSAKEMFRIFALYKRASSIYGKVNSRKYIENIFAELDCPEGWKAGKILSKCLFDKHLVKKICINKDVELHPLDFPESGNVKKFWNLSRLLNDDQDDNDREMKPLYQKLWDTFILNLHSLQPKESVENLYYSWEGASQYKEGIHEMTKVVDYGIEDSELVMDLFETLNTWTALVETTNVCGVPISDLYTRGQQIRGISLVYDLAVKKGIVLDERQMEYIKMAGGYVGDPKPGLYDHVICVDFTSLYPTIIMAHNICWTTLVPPELVDIIPDNMCHIIEWDQDFEVEDEEQEEIKEKRGRRKKKEPKFITKHFKYKFVRKEVKEGILPQLVGHLVYERRRVRAQIDLTDNPVTKGVLNSRQLALKVTGNSCYGILSAQTSGKLSLVEGGMSVTAIGRQSILKANKIIEEQYGGTVVYGDTDSTMFQIPGCDTGLKCVTRGPEIADELNKYYPAPMKFEFEKAMRILTICPKKYAAFLYAEKDVKDRKTGEVIYKKGELITDMYRIFVRGIILARRDNCNWQRTIYRNVLWKILMFRSLKESLNYIIDSILQLVTRNVDLSELVLVRGLGSNYKSETYMMKIFADELRKIGKPAQPGDRLEYVVVRPYGTDPNQKAKDVLKLGYRMRLVSTYLERLESDKSEPIDVVYYIEKLLKNAIEQIFAIGYKKELDEITKNYEKKKRNVLYTRIDSEPIKMFLSVMKEKQKVINVVNGTNPDTKPKKKRIPKKKIVKKELSPSWKNFIRTNNNTRKVTLKIIE